MSELAHIIVKLPKSLQWWEYIRRRADRWPERVDMPVKLKFENGAYRLVDGMHRICMAVICNDETILADVINVRDMNL